MSHINNTIVYLMMSNANMWVVSLPYYVATHVIMWLFPLQSSVNCLLKEQHVENLGSKLMFLSLLIRINFGGISLMACNQPWWYSQRLM